MVVWQVYVSKRRWRSSALFDSVKNCMPWLSLDLIAIICGYAHGGKRVLFLLLQ